MSRTSQNNNEIINQCSVNIAAGLTTLLTSALAAKIANRPTVLRSVGNYSGNSRLVTGFLMQHATAVDGLIAKANLWAWGARGGVLLASLQITAGATAVVDADVSIEGLDLSDGQWAWADTIAEIDTIGDTILQYYGVSAGDGIYEVLIDLMGNGLILWDFDKTYGAGNDPSDIIAIGRLV